MVIQKTDQTMQAVQNENLQKSAGKRNRRAQNTQNTKKNVDGRFLIAGSSKEQIEKKRKLAQKQAMKLVKDAFSGDQATKQNIEDLKAQKAEKVAEYQEKMQQIGNISAEKDKLRETYGISKDSQEQKDLELLEKYQNNKLGFFSDDFSKEEIDRLKELANEPRTEYQKQVLSLNGKKGCFAVRCRSYAAADHGADAKSVGCQGGSVKIPGYVKSRRCCGRDPKSSIG